MFTHTVLKSQEDPIPLPQVVFFDWDNTLVDTWEGIKNALNHTFQSFGMPLWDMDDVKHKVLLSARDAFPQWFKNDYLKALDIFYKFVSENHLTHLNALPDSKNLLMAFAKKNIPIVIISNKKGEILRKEVDHLGWTNYFDLVLGSGDCLEDKPSAQPVYFARQKLFVGPKDNWFFGDSLVDFKCAQASSCLAIGIGVDQTLHADCFQFFESCKSARIFVEELLA